MHHVDTVFTNWFYPQNSELLHAVGILLTGRDTLSLFLNFGWLAVAFLAAWCIGQALRARAPERRRRGDRARVPHAGRARAGGGQERPGGRGAAARRDRDPRQRLGAAGEGRVAERRERRGNGASLPVGWPLAAAGLAVGLAAGTKVTALAMAAALSVAVLVLAPAGRRWAAAAWWFVPALLGGGFWYLRNLVVAGNPLPAVEQPGADLAAASRSGCRSAGPTSASPTTRPTPASGAITSPPACTSAFGALWPLVVGGAIVAALLALLRGPRPRRPLGRRRRPVRPRRLPLHAAQRRRRRGRPGRLRDQHPLRLSRPCSRGWCCCRCRALFDDRRRQWGLLGALLLVLVAHRPRRRRPPRPRARLRAAAGGAGRRCVPAALLLARARGAGRGAVAGGFAALALAVVAIGYPVQRHYLRRPLPQRRSPTKASPA